VILLWFEFKRNNKGHKQHNNNLALPTTLVWLVSILSFIMNITPDLPFLYIHNPFTNERIRVYLDKQSHMSLDTKDYLFKQISHLSKGVVIVASTYCQLVKQQWAIEKKCMFRKRRTIYTKLENGCGYNVCFLILQISSLFLKKNKIYRKNRTSHLQIYII